jgi:hypothetical protein
MPSRPRFVLAGMVVLAIILGISLFVRTGSDTGNPPNPAPHAPDQTPR